MWTEHDDLEPCTSLVETLKGIGGGRGFAGRRWRGECGVKSIEMHQKYKIFLLT